MQDSTHKLIHTFAALADLGQEIADTSNFEEMVRASLHHLLGALAIRRGAVVEYNVTSAELKFVAARGIGEDFPKNSPLTINGLEELQSFGLCCLTVRDAQPQFQRIVEQNRTLFDYLRTELCVPLVIRGQLRGLIFLGSKASGESFTPDDCEVICAMARHIGVGIHAHRLLEEIEHRAEENRRLYDGMRAIYKDTVRAFA
ncbi:MAG TPA: GAF domain-containing protein, partial [Pyrinomonadaceae bacterium]|nr:GAF domain-containing protein [Pyrinomonadaceae bacterium]